jgi:hypothetical protein
VANYERISIILKNYVTISSPQENFKKSSYGLLHIIEVGGADAVAAIKSVDDQDLRPSIFRGAENLIPPDVRALLLCLISEWLGKGSEINQGLLICESKGVTAKMLQAEIIKLKKERYLQWHLLHPENTKIHESRSV